MSGNSQPAECISAESPRQVDREVLSGEACVKCGFRCIEGCS